MSCMGGCQKCKDIPLALSLKIIPTSTLGPKVYKQYLHGVLGLGRPGPVRILNRGGRLERQAKAIKATAASTDH